MTTRTNSPRMSPNQQWLIVLAAVALAFLLAAVALTSIVKSRLGDGALGRPAPSVQVVDTGRR